MAKPVATGSQIAAIESTVLDQTVQQSAFTETAALQNAVILKATEVDTAFQSLFAWYNDLVIGKYDAEKKEINGTFIVSPVIEADILAVATNPPTGRLIPTPPTKDIVRIAEFDGGGTSSTLVNEQQHITDQAAVETLLQTGSAGTLPTLTATSLTNSALTNISTTLNMIDTVGPMSFVIGDVFVVHDGGTNAALVQVTSVTDNMGGNPPYSFTLGIIQIIKPAATIVTSSNTIAGFTGFTNAERTAKITTDPNVQPLMNTLIDSLEARINDRKTRMTAQTSALNTNEDPDAVANITTAKSNIVISDGFLTSYLISTDISNTGLSALSTERTTRSGQLTTRLSQISAAYTGQTENYYDQRYSMANNRGNTQRGTLRAKSNAQSVKDDMLSLAAQLTGSIAALNSILP